MKLTTERVRVIATAAVTWLVAASAAAQLVADDAAEILDPVVPGLSDDVVAWALRVVGWLGVAVTIIRRVTPVPESQRGVLPLRRRR